MDMVIVIFVIMVIVVWYQNKVERELQNKELIFFDWNKWKRIKRKSWWLFLDFEYLKMEKELMSWSKCELITMKALCKKKISSRNIWSEVVPAIAIFTGILSASISVFGIVADLHVSLPQEDIENAGQMFYDDIVQYDIIAIIPFVLWFISVAEYFLSKRYKNILIMCESILEQKEE